MCPTIPDADGRSNSIRKWTYLMKNENFPSVNGWGVCKIKPVRLFIRLWNASVGCFAATAGQSSRRPTGKFRQTRRLARVFVGERRFWINVVAKFIGLRRFVPTVSFKRTFIWTTRHGERVLFMNIVWPNFFLNNAIKTSEPLLTAAAD